MEAILQGCEGIVVYQDDILVYGPNIKEHDNRLQIAPKKIAEHGLQLNDENCKYRQASMRFLGHMFDSKGTQPDPDKIRAIEALNRPTDIPSLRRFLGMVNYMQCYIPHLAKLASPLNRLLREDTQWVWDRYQEKAIANIIAQLKQSPALRYYDKSAPTCLHADASQNGI